MVLFSWSASPIQNNQEFQSRVSGATAAYRFFEDDLQCFQNEKLLYYVSTLVFIPERGFLPNI